ncbi:MAG TPA: hypothetical protein VF420_07185 [Casimicrobiaceae bacterium]
MDVARSWEELPLGARAAIEPQSSALRAGGLPCGSSPVAGTGERR